MKGSYFLVAGALFASLVFNTSCSSTDDEGGNVNVNKQSQSDFKSFNLTEAQQAMVKSSNNFALKLMKVENEEQAGRSFVVSPLSVSFLLGMINNGAQGTTQQEIVSALGFSDSNVEEANTYFQLLMNQAPEIDQKVNLSIANMVYVNKAKGIEFSSDYCNTTKNYYKAGIESMDFTKSSSLQTINSWCNDHTNGAIPAILTEQEFNEDAVSYLLNTIYFKAPWAGSFNKELTRKADFTREDGTKYQVDMMSKTATVGHFVNNDLRAISLPYANGNYQMMVILPGEENCTKVADVLAKLSPSYWKQLTTSIGRASQETDVYLPRFQSETKLELNEPLKQLGVKKAFSTEADFSKMLAGDSKVFLSKVLQKARVEVTEDGTEAAAVTEGEMAVTADSNAGEKNVFRADRPFVYVIYEKTSNAIFFIGQFTGNE